MIRKFAFILALGGTLFFAQAAGAYSISPTKYLITVDPGKTETATIKIKNEEPMPLIFKLKVMGLGQDKDGRPIITDKINDEAGAWIKPEADSVSVEPGETTEAKYLITAPENAISGSHYLALAIEPVVTEGAGVSVSSRLVTLLTLQVGGMVRESVEIKEWKPEKGFLSSKDNWKFNLQMANRGNIEVSMKGTLTLKNWQGNEIFSEDKKLGNILLSGAERNLSLDLDAQRTNIYLPGLYQAQIKVLYGRTGQIVVGSANFWYFPTWIWWTLGGLIVLIVLLVISFKKLRR